MLESIFLISQYFSDLKVASPVYSCLSADFLLLHGYFASRALRIESLRRNYQFSLAAPPIQSTTITSDACHEALSVKKSAEIAALFADIKLSQTTDITHIMPEQLRRLSIVSNRAAYSRIASGKAHTKSTKYSSSDPVPYQRVVQNSLYAGKHQKNGMYSTDNGLYTIQSQSDDSRRSSVSEIIEAQKDGDEYLNVDGQKNVSSSLENSLGYLP